MLAGIPRRDQEGFRAALRSRNGGKLFRAYRSIGDLAGERPLSDGLRSALVRTGQLLCAQAIDLDAALGQELGHEPSVLPVADPPAPRPESFGAARLIDEMIPVARERIAAETDEAVSAYVKGGGEAATQVRGLFATRLGPEPGSPESTLRDDFQSLVGTMLTRTVLKDMKLFAAGKTTQFDLDLGRNFKIVLQGVGEISTDSSVARDQFARFVTKDPAATYESLTPSARNKANLAMSLASQGTHNAVAFGFGVLLDPQERVPAVAFNGDLEERTFTMELDGNGGLAVRFRSRQKPTQVMLNGELTPCGPGSSVRADLDLHVDAQELERLAALDFATYDDAPLQKIIDQEQPPEKFRRAKFAISQPFRLRMDVGPVLVADLR